MVPEIVYHCTLHILQYIRKTDITCVYLPSTFYSLRCNLTLGWCTLASPRDGWACSSRISLLCCQCIPSQQITDERTINLTNILIESDFKGLERLHVSKKYAALFSGTYGLTVPDCMDSSSSCMKPNCN